MSYMIYDEVFLTREKLILLPRKEVIQPQVLLQLPCYDFTPVILFTLTTRLSLPVS